MQIKNKVLKIFDLIIFIKSHMLVYRHIPRYNAKTRKQNILIIIKIIKLFKVKNARKTAGILKSNRNNILRYIDIEMIKVSILINRKKLRFKRFFK